MRKIISLVVLLTLMAFTLPAFAEACTPNMPNGTKTVNLLDSQAIVAGAVTAQVVADDVVVTIATTDGWLLKSAQLWMGTSMVQMPQTKTGNPKVGQFPHKNEAATGATTVSFTIPLDDLGYSCKDKGVTYQIAAHADVYKTDSAGVVIQSDGAWAEGPRLVEQGNWATYFTFYVDCVCADLSGLKDCESAFAADTQVSFCELEYKNLNGYYKLSYWGWSIDFWNHKFPVTYQIWAGAEKCDRSYGTHVGDLTVSIVDKIGTATITLKDDVVMNEAQLYIGKYFLPLVGKNYTDAPGQYTFQQQMDNASTATFVLDFNTLGESAYFVTHARVCPKVVKPPIQ